MAELKETGFDPEKIFNEGVQYQAEQDDTELREQIAEQMIANGIDPDEVQQALYSEGSDVYAPGRGKHRGKYGKRKCSAKQWAKMPQICRGTKGAKVRTAKAPVMVYDPPRGGYRAAATRYYKKKGGAKGLVAGLRPLILPGATLATVYSKYQERAVALKAAGAKNKDGTPVDGVFQALMYDIQNRPTTSVMDRMKTNASDIITPALMGVGLKYGAKKVKLHPKVNQVASMGGDALIGVAIGKVISTLLDPPNPAPMRQQPIQVVQQMQTQAAPVNSYSTPGGFY